MINLKKIQKEIGVWSDKNFSKNGRPAYRSLLGLGEECGEIFHSHLKLEQEIRGSKEEHLADIKDGIGDVIVYLADYCYMMGFNMEDIIKETWSQVKKRDWNKNRKTGEIKSSKNPPDSISQITTIKGI